ncbi:hypothetical protein RIF29_36298 [Crotalaria pallida]|uniref:Uncharacterized protein n=1 Tax=Crotalaria pallida TaxID=3830 RepID=A0AAN9EB49_CROPI
MGVRCKPLCSSGILRYDEDGLFLPENKILASARSIRFCFLYLVMLFAADLGAFLVYISSKELAMKDANELKVDAF